MSESISTIVSNVAAAFQTGSFIAGLIVGGFVPMLGFAKKIIHLFNPGNKSAMKAVAVLDAKINSNITNLRFNLGAVRCIIKQFHNGDHYFNGGDLQRVAPTHESAKDGFSEITGRILGVPTSLVSGVITLMLQDLPVVHTVDGMEDCYAKVEMEKYRITHILILPIHQGKFRIVGYLKICWMHDPKLTQAQIDQIKDCRISAEGVLAQSAVLTGKMMK